MGMNIDAHLHIFHKAIQANGKKMMLISLIVNLFCFIIRNAISEWGEIFMKTHLVYRFEKLKVTLCKC
jgi:sugar phosphate permease